MLPEFETAVLGMTVGASKKFPLSFPADYQGKDVAGKTVEFTVTLKKLEWAHMPEVDADFVKSLGIDGDISKMRAEIQENLERESDSRVKAINKNNVMDALLKVSECDVPKVLVDQEITHLMGMMRQNMSQSGMDPATMALPPELFTPQAERRVRLGMILSDMVKLHELKATPEQVRAKVEALAKSYQDPEMVINYYYADRNRMAEVESLVIEENVMEYVLGKAKVVDKVMPFNELMSKNPQA
jgi:trigger factor